MAKSKAKAKAKSKPKKAAKKVKRTRQAKSGTPFELRAAHALAVINPDLSTQHNVDLMMRWGKTQQFDIAMRAGSDLRKVFEAKDYGTSVPIEKSQAFDSKTSDLAVPPTDGAGLISSLGFQSGVLDRSRVRGKEIFVRELYQLRDVSEADWEGRAKSIQLAVLSRNLQPEDVRLTLAPGEPPPPTAWFKAGREHLFLYDANAQIKSNLLDDLNDRIRAIRLDLGPGEGPTTSAINIEFDDSTFLRLDARPTRVLRVDLALTVRDLSSKISVDFASGARDTLIDCLKGQDWIIPDPDKAISASRTGYDVELTYADKGKASLGALSLPSNLGSGSAEHKNPHFVNALQTQMLLRALGADRANAPSDPERQALSEQLRTAQERLQAKDYDGAKAIYWETCSKATSLDALINLAYMYEREQSLDDALRLTMRAIELFPLEAQGWDSAAAVLITSNRLDEAEEIFQGSRFLHAGNPVLIQREAVLRARQERWAEAVQLYAHLCAVDRKSAKMRLCLAECESELGDRAAAGWDAHAAFELGLGHPDLEALAVHLMVRSARFPDAFSASQSLLSRLPPDTPPAKMAALKLDAAVAAYESDQLDSAARLIDGLTLDVPAIHHLRGLLHYRRGEYSASRDEFRLFATAEKPAARVAFSNLAIAATAARAFPEAYASLCNSVFDDDESSQHWSLRCMAAARVGNGDDARASAGRAANGGADAATLLVAASDAAFALQHHDAGAMLRMGSLDYQTKADSILIKQRAPPASA